MRVKREEFLAMLNRVQAGLSKSAFVEQSSCFVFQDGYACTYNDEVSCRTKSNLDITGAVRAKQLIGVLMNMSDEEVDIKPKEKELQIIGVRKKAGVVMESEILLPVNQVEAPAKEDWHDLAEPKDFSNAVEQVCAVTANKEDEFLTSAVHICSTHIEASDRKQMCRHTMSIPVTRSFLVRAKSIKHIVGLDLTRIAEAQDWLHIRNKTLIFSCRRHLEPYPDLSEPLRFVGRKVMLPKGGIEAARIGSTFSSEDKENDKVKVTLKKDSLIISGSSAHGWATADLQCHYKGDEVSFWISPKMLENLIENYSECEIGDGKLGVKGEHWQYLVSLSRDKDSKPEPEESSVELEGDEELQEGLESAEE